MVIEDMTADAWESVNMPEGVFIRRQIRIHDPFSKILKTAVPAAVDVVAPKADASVEHIESRGPQQEGRENCY